MRLASVFRALGVSLAICLGAQASESVKQTVPTPTKSLVAAAFDPERLGLEIYRADRSAWLTADLLAKSQSLSRIPGKAAGWVTSAMDAKRKLWRVAYLAETSEGLVSFADGSVDFSTGIPVASLRENVPARKLDAAELAQYDVRQKTLMLEWLRCARKYNYVTIAAPSEGWFVYMLPAQESSREFPMGGFHRFYYRHMAAMQHYAQTRGCVTQSEDDVPKDATLASLMITHITSATPTEMHVFMNLAYGKPIFVSTRDGKLWSIEQGRIKETEHLDSQP